jgi:GT2 family glycosyltransferase
MQPFVSIVILNWNGKRFIKECLDSLLAIDYKTYEVIFVDNGSSDDSLAFMKKNYRSQLSRKKFRIIENNANLGVPEGNNVGIRKALEKTKAKYVVMLNNDTKVERKWLSSLVNTAEKDKKIGAIQSKMLRFDKKTIDSAGALIYNPLAIAVDRGQGEEDIGQYDQREEMLALCAAGALFRSDALQDVEMSGDYLDKEFFCMWEDIDLSVRIFLAGWKVVYEPSSVMYHRRSPSTGKKNPFSAYYLHRNNIWFVAKCVPGRVFIKHIIPFLVFNAMTFFGFLIIRRECFLPFAKAKLDSLLGLGKMLAKRKLIMKKSRAKSSEFERLLSKKFVPSAFYG